MKILLVLFPLLASFQALASDKLVAKEVITIKANTSETNIPVASGSCALKHDSRGYERHIDQGSVFLVNKISNDGATFDSLESIAQQSNHIPNVSEGNRTAADFKLTQTPPSAAAWKELTDILLNKFGIVTNGTDWPFHTDYSISISPFASFEKFDIVCQSRNKNLTDGDVMTLFVNSSLDVSRDL